MIRVGIMLPKLGPYGGAEQFGYRLAGFLAAHPDRDFEVTYVCARQDGEAPPGVRVLTVGRPLPGKLGKIVWFALRAEQIRRREHFDVTVGLGNTLHQDILRLSGGPTGLFWDFSIRAYPAGLPRICKSLTRRLSPGKQLARLIETVQVRQTPVLVANSEFVRDLTVRAFPHLDSARLPIIYNRPDTSRFCPAAPGTRTALRHGFGLPENANLVLTAGTNFRLKGVHVLVEALSLLPLSWHLAVAGGRGSRDLTRLAAGLGVRDRVHFLGRVDDMPLLYQAADVFVLNTFYDACANAVLEALACGLPTLSTACNGSSAFLRPEAVLADPADHALLAKRILAVHGTGSTARPDFAPPSGLEPYADLIRSLA